MIVNPFFEGFSLARCIPHIYPLDLTVAYYTVMMIQQLPFKITGLV